MFKVDNSRPEGLCEKGNQAYDIIMRALTVYDKLNTGGCQTFYSPQEWKDRGEAYGCESVLIVVHDGGDHRPFFTLDGEVYAMYEFLLETLSNEGGMYQETCTCWYTAIYVD